MKKGSNVVYHIAWILVIIGGLNWGLVGLGSFLGRDLNVVHLLLSNWMQVEAAVYLLVGLATLYKLIMHKSECGYCGGGYNCDCGSDCNCDGKKEGKTM